jgi:transposase-like protein
MAKKSELKVEERVEAVLALLRREEAAAVLARRYQVSEVTLYRWRDVFLESGKAGLGKPEGSAESAAARRIEQLEGELAQRAQVIGELTIANGILKKLQNRSR